MKFSCDDSIYQRVVPYVSEIPVQDFDIAMDDLQCDQLIVLWAHSCDKVQTRVSTKIEVKGSKLALASKVAGCSLSPLFSCRIPHFLRCTFDK